MKDKEDRSVLFYDTATR